MVKLKNNYDNSIPLGAMEDGQIGVIVDWPNEYHIGEFVMRHGNSLIAIGMVEGRSWHGIFSSCHISNRVRLLRSDEPLYVNNDILGE